MSFTCLCFHSGDFLSTYNTSHIIYKTIALYIDIYNTYRHGNKSDWNFRPYSFQPLLSVLNT